MLFSALIFLEHVQQASDLAAYDCKLAIILCNKAKKNNKEDLINLMVYRKKLVQFKEKKTNPIKTLNFE